jgi:hypothetical protein
VALPNQPGTDLAPVGWWRRHSGTPATTMETAGPTSPCSGRPMGPGISGWSPALPLEFSGEAPATCRSSRGNEIGHRPMPRPRASRSDCPSRQSPYESVNLLTDR